MPDEGEPLGRPSELGRLRIEEVATVRDDSPPARETLLRDGDVRLTDEPSETFGGPSRKSRMS